VFRQATVYKGRNRDTAWYAAIDQDPTNFDERGKQRIPLANLTAPILKQRG
jgi:hypothetical protein